MTQPYTFKTFRSLFLVFTLHQTLSHITLKPYGYDIVQYTRALPVELRESVKAALTAERSAVQSKALSLQQTDCQKDEGEPIRCPPNKYRTQTGECNNIRHPKWGMRGTPFLRLLSPEYADGEWLII